jgi:predicted MPP superfamily phosphohydrolase
VVFLGLAVLFLANVETRIRRRRALAAIHELRSIAHIVDMHQLTKDPDQFLAEGSVTVSSPQRTMTRFQLARYLDYCTELLSLTSKVAALYVQDFQDPVVLDAVTDVENLTTGLSRKIWQKIMIVDR